MSEFKFNGYKNQVWDGDSLRRTLVRDYPGANSLQEALEMAKKERSPRESLDDAMRDHERFEEIPKTSPKPSLTEVSVKEDDPLLLAMRIAIAAQVEAQNAHPDWQMRVTGDDLVRTARMPISTVAEIKAWGEACVKLIQDKIIK